MLNAKPNTNWGTWTTFYMAKGPDVDGPALNTSINGTPIDFTSQDGDFNYSLQSSGTSLDSDNFLSLINLGNGKFNIHVNESGWSMDGTYTVNVTGKASGTNDGFIQQFVYTTIGNDVTSVITAQDTDNTTVGVDQSDITVAWNFMDTTVTSQKVYVLPVDTTLAASHNPVATFNDSTTKSWTGITTNTADSNDTALGAGKYTVYVVTEDSTNTVRTLSTEVTLKSE